MSKPEPPAPPVPRPRIPTTPGQPGAPSVPAPTSTSPGSPSAPGGAPPAPPDPSEKLPRPFGRYVLFDEIGRGGMAKVFLARLRLEYDGERLMVVKRILRELSSDPEFSAMLTAEAKLAAHLTHANVVQVLELGREEGQLFIAMEYVEGFDLNELLRRLTKSKIPLPVEFALFIVRELLAALDYAHRARTPKGDALNIVHRDVSPSNVLVSFEGEVKLCDFGIARASGSEAPDANTIQRTRLAGKAAYMSPEHAKGETIDRRADLFSAGVLLWELCAGRRLYRGTEREMMALAKRADIPPLPPRGLPQQATLQAILDNALSKRTNDRWPTAAEFLRALDNYVLETRIGASQLRFGQFLTQHFANDIVAVRRQREIAARLVPAVALASTEDFDEEQTTLEATPPPIVIEDVSGMPTITRPTTSQEQATIVAARAASENTEDEHALDVRTDDLIDAITADDGNRSDDDDHESLAHAPEELSTTADAPAAIIARRSLAVATMRKSGKGKASASAKSNATTSMQKRSREPVPLPLPEPLVQSPPEAGEVPVPTPAPVIDAPAADPLAGLPELPPLNAPAPVIVRHLPLSLALAALFAIGLTVGVGVAAVLLFVT